MAGGFSIKARVQRQCNAAESSVRSGNQKEFQMLRRQLKRLLRHPFPLLLRPKLKFESIKRNLFSLSRHASENGRLQLQLPLHLQLRLRQHVLLSRRPLIQCESSCSKPLRMKRTSTVLALLAAVQTALKKFPIRHENAAKKKRRTRTPGHRLTVKVIQRSERCTTSVDRLQVYVPKVAQYDPTTKTFRKYLYCRQHDDCNFHNAKLLKFFEDYMHQAMDDLNDEDLIEWVHCNVEKGTQHPTFLYICQLWQQKSGDISTETSVEPSVESSLEPSTPTVIKQASE